MPKTTPKTTNSTARKIVNTLLAVLLFFTLCYLFGIKDYIIASTFKPSDAISYMLKNIDFTEKGERIMLATRPELENAAAFNENCSSDDSEVYVLGCYNSKSDRLHLYDIQTDDLDGIVESTAAHEMLHAAWQRLPFWEQVSLSSELAAIYRDLPEDSDIKEAMKLYSESEFYNELHSRIGTEIADLPESLEKHYSSYFKDQDAVVEFHTAYNEKYKNLEKELISLEEEVTSLNEEVSGEIKHYDSWSEELNNKIVQFNSAVDDMSEMEYYSKRGELEKEIKKIEDYYDKLDKKVNHYNELIEKYRAAAAKQGKILESINSNSGEITTPKNVTNPLDKDPQEILKK